MHGFAAAVGAPGKKKKEVRTVSPQVDGDGDLSVTGKAHRRSSAALLTPRASQDNLSIMSSISSEMSTVVGQCCSLEGFQFFADTNFFLLLFCDHKTVLLNRCSLKTKKLEIVNVNTTSVLESCILNIYGFGKGL